MYLNIVTHDKKQCKIMLDAFKFQVSEIFRLPLL